MSAVTARHHLPARPRDPNHETAVQERYDHVIVGAGSAGCVLAARLTEDPSVTVLLLEAGGDDRVDEIMIPAAFAKQFRTKLDWGDATDPQKHAQGRKLYWPRGKALGGSSSMNAMIYIRGSRLDDNECWRDRVCR